MKSMGREKERWETLKFTLCPERHEEYAGFLQKNGQPEEFPSAARFVLKIRGLL